MSGHYHNFVGCVYLLLRYAHITNVDSTAVPFGVFRNCTVFSVAFGDATFTDG
jgi:hypothetical protein